MGTRIDQNALQKLLDIGDDGHNLIVELVDLLEITRPKYVNLMSDSLRTGNFREIARGAHTLKSSAASLGAQELQALCYDFEKRLLESGLNDSLICEKAISEIDLLVGQSVSALRSLGYDKKR